jgi:uncharacterized protein (TIGR00106 family)
MLFDLSIIPMGKDGRSSKQIAEAIRIIEKSGLRFQLTPTSTCIEGSWEEVMPVIERCHNMTRGETNHVVTMIKIEDDPSSSPQIERNVTSVEEKIGHAVSARA